MTKRKKNTALESFKNTGLIGGTRVISILDENKIITVTGPPGTSKTFIACYAATQALLAGKCKKIILSKPTEVLSGTRDPGALPGTLDEKMAVFADSFIDSLEE